MTGLQHKDDYFETPEHIVEEIESKTGLTFTLDLCATHENRKTLWYLSEDDDFLTYPIGINTVCFCNPPRSKNGKFVNRVLEWWRYNNDIVMLLCWNDLGNKYGAKILKGILDGSIEVGNLGKVKFNKNGKESEFVSRLTYFWAWFKKQ